MLPPGRELRTHKGKPLCDHCDGIAKTVYRRHPVCASCVVHLVQATIAKYRGEDVPPTIDDFAVMRSSSIRECARWAPECGDKGTNYEKRARAWRHK
jgi:hypothetical protein